MAEMHFGNTTLTSVVYNGVDLDKVYFNGTLVFEKKKSSKDTISFLYYASTSMSGATFGFAETASYSLTNSPKKVTSIQGGLGNTIWTITSDLKGTVKMPSDSQSSSGSILQGFVELNWSISGSTFTITCSSPGAGPGEHVDISISYEY